MAVTTAMVLAGVSAASSIMGGIQQNAAAKQQANMAEAQGILQSEENVRVAAAQAQQESAASDDARRRQKLAYLKAGVSLEGSPLLMMEDTRLRGERNVDEIIAAGASGSAAAIQEGRTNAANYRASGRQALMAGIGAAAGSMGNFAGSFGGKSSSGYNRAAGIKQRGSFTMTDSVGQINWNN